MNTQQHIDAIMHELKSMILTPQKTGFQTVAVFRNRNIELYETDATCRSQTDISLSDNLARPYNEYPIEKHLALFICMTLLHNMRITKTTIDQAIKITEPSTIKPKPHLLDALIRLATGAIGKNDELPLVFCKQLSDVTSKCFHLWGAEFQKWVKVFKKKSDVPKEDYDKGNEIFSSYSAVKSLCKINEEPLSQASYSESQTILNDWKSAIEREKLLLLARSCGTQNVQTITAL